MSVVWQVENQKKKNACSIAHFAPSHLLSPLFPFTFRSFTCPPFLYTPTLATVFSGTPSTLWLPWLTPTSCSCLAIGRTISLCRPCRFFGPRSPALSATMAPPELRSSHWVSLHRQTPNPSMVVASPPWWPLHNLNQLPLARLSAWRLL